MANTELHDVPGWSPLHVAQMAKSWINSAEQVVAISVTSGGMASLAQQLSVTEEEARRLVDLARAALSHEAQAEMGQPFTSDERGMGSMVPEKEGDKKTGKS